MSGELAADVTMRALTARAVEPHGRGGHGLCLNCGTRLIGEHCHQCGQPGHVHRTVGAIGHELAHGVFHFEGKIWRTLPMLVLHPGALTRRYIAGERTRFVSPLALFLFTVFLMFATISALGPGDFGRGMQTGVSGAQNAVAQGEAKTLERLSALRRERHAALVAHRTTAAIDRRIADQQNDLRILRETQARFALGTPDTIGIHEKPGWLGTIVHKVRENPGLVAYKLQSSAYKFSWALIPLSVPFVALLFLWRRRYGMYDHAVFVTYSLSFMTLLVVALTLMGAAGAGSDVIAPVALLGPPLHIFAQLRGAYSLKLFSAAWRTALLLGFSIAVLALFAAGLVALGLGH